ncbi:hypothetical protein STEG23_024462 [Scotinomys teguina]
MFLLQALPPQGVRYDFISALALCPLSYNEAGSSPNQAALAFSTVENTCRVVTRNQKSRRMLLLAYVPAHLKRVDEKQGGHLMSLIVLKEVKFLLNLLNGSSSQSSTVRSSSPSKELLVDCPLQ